MTPTKPQVPVAPGSSQTDPPPLGSILVIRGVKIGALESLRIVRYEGTGISDLRIHEWTEGHLNATTLAEIEAVLLDQLHKGLAMHFGIQGELLEALGGP